jgi:tRNA 2-selenouridine synthase
LEALDLLLARRHALRRHGAYLSHHRLGRHAARWRLQGLAAPGRARPYSAAGTFQLSRDLRPHRLGQKLAAHKGSVLGDLPGAPQPTQKSFESRIWLALSQLDPARPVYVEAESRKVGNLRVPPALIEQMWLGRCFELVTAPALRLKLLREEYAHLIADHELLFFKLDCLKALHSKDVIDQWKAHAAAGEWDAFVGDMLVRHYDPAYERSMFKNYVHAPIATPIALRTLSAAGFAEAAKTLPV